MTKEQLQQMDATLVAFMETPVYRNILSTIKREIQQVEGSILGNPPLTPLDVAENLVAYGKRERLIESLNDFESYRGTLKAELDRMSESDTNTTQNENIE